MVWRGAYITYVCQTTADIFVTQESRGAKASRLSLYWSPYLQRIPVSQTNPTGLSDPDTTRTDTGLGGPRAPGHVVTATS